MCHSICLFLRFNPDTVCTLMRPLIEFDPTTVRMNSKLVNPTGSSFVWGDSKWCGFTGLVNVKLESKEIMQIDV